VKTEEDAIINTMIKKIFSNWYAIAILLFLFCLTVQLFWLCAFFPATMTGDSLNFWRMSAVGSGYKNIQPILYTYLLYGLRQIWDSPAIVSILQTVISSLLLTYFSIFLLKKGANKILVFLGYFAFVFSLPINITNTYIHKDSLYAQLLLLLSIILVGLFFKERDKTKSINFYVIGFLVAIVASIRYDGAVYLILIPLIMYFYKLANKKNLTIVIISSLSLFFCLQVPLPIFLKVNESRYEQFYCVETQVIGLIYQQHGSSFSMADKSIMNTLTPLSNWKNISPTGTEIYWRSTFKKDDFKDKNFVSKWNALFLTKMKEYPLYYFKGRVQMTVALLSGYRIYLPGIKRSELGLQQTPIFTKYDFNGFFLKLVDQSYYENLVARFFLWSPFFLLVHGTFLIMAIIKKKKYMIVYGLIFLVSFLAVIPMVTSSQFRYMYPLFYSSFFVPALYTLKERVRNE
jgi:hypothetical protein